jgi:hypothetical protein
VITVNIILALYIPFGKFVDGEKMIVTNEQGLGRR